MDNTDTTHVLNETKLDEFAAEARRRETRRIARDLYATYCASSDGKNYQGLPCPEWDALTEAVRGHWFTVAQRVRQLAATAARTGNADAMLDVAMLFAPMAQVLEHLPVPDAAIATWRKYVGLEG